MSSCASSTGATTASSTSASGGWSRSISRSSLTRMVGALPVWSRVWWPVGSFAAPVPRAPGRSVLVLEPRRPLLEQVEAHVAATHERVAERLLVTRVDVGELDRDPRDHRQAALGSIGDAR